MRFRKCHDLRKAALSGALDTTLKQRLCDALSSMIFIDGHPHDTATLRFKQQTDGPNETTITLSHIELVPRPYEGLVYVSKIWIQRFIDDTEVFAQTLQYNAASIFLITRIKWPNDKHFAFLPAFGLYSKTFKLSRGIQAVKLMRTRSMKIGFGAIGVNPWRSERAH
jgi:hypothetical protein